MRETVLDQAQLGEAGENWAFWRALADAELFLLLTEEPQGADLSPQIYDLSDGRVVLAFDREDRLAAFSPVAVPYAALPGRVIAALAAEHGLALGLNLGTGAASETVLPSDALAWLVDMLNEAPVQVVAEDPEAVSAPVLDAAGLAAVGDAIRSASGLAEEALVAQVVYRGGRRGHLLAFPGVDPADEAAIARGVAEALVFSGLEAAALDVAFPGADDPLTEALRRVARRYAPAQTPVEPAPAAKAPGMDKTRPPILK